MRDDVQRDFDRQRAFIPLMRSIVGCQLGPHMFVEASSDQDMRENSDLVILRALDIRVGCRVRFVRPGKQHFEWPEEITLRVWRKDCPETEFHKMMNGWGHAFFYGLGRESPPNFERWSLVSLKHIRRFFSGFAPSGGKDDIDRSVAFAKASGFRRAKGQLNKDKRTGFLILHLRDMVDYPNMIITCDPALSASVNPPRKAHHRAFFRTSEPTLFDNADPLDWLRD